MKIYFWDGQQFATLFEAGANRSENLVMGGRSAQDVTLVTDYELF